MYIDDIIITGLDHGVIISLKSFLHSQLKLKDLGKLKYFFGLEITRSHKRIYLSWRNYNLQLLEDIGFLAYKPALLPIDPKVHLNSFDGDLLVNIDASSYRRPIGHLLYLTISRPNITFADHKLSQFVSEPR